MEITEICRSAARLRRRCGSADPYRLARALGVRVIPRHLGTSPNCIRGFYLECKRIRTVTLNADLPEPVLRVVLAHELGHAVLHRSAMVQPFPAGIPLGTANEAEREANFFAAELLLEDGEVLALLEAGEPLENAAARLGVMPELMDFKLRALRAKGVPIPESPARTRNGFLASVPTRARP